MSRSKQRILHDGQKIYDTARIESAPAVLAGYNCGYEERLPTFSVGSVSEFTAYWERYLYRRTIKCLEFTMPTTWDKDYFLWVLFRNGFLALVDTPKFGIIPQACGIGSQRNVFYQPTRVIVANPLITKKGYTLGTDSALIKLTPDYQGIWDLVHHYAEELAMLTQSLRMAIIASRMNKGYATDSNAVAQTLKTIWELTDKGQVGVAVNTSNFNLSKDKPLPWVEITNDVGANYLVDKLQDAIENCLARYNKDIGIPTVSDKKERLISDEADAQIGAAMTSIDIWLDCLQRSIDIAKEVFPDLNFSVRRPIYGEEEEKKDESEIQPSKDV